MVDENKKDSDAQIQKIVARITQMKGMAKSTHSVHEAETMLAMVAKLMTQYQLDDAMLEAAGKTLDEEQILDPNSEDNVVYETGRSVPWKQTLFFGVAKMHGLYGVQFHIPRRAKSHHKGTRYRVFGRKSDIQVCKYVFDFMANLIPELANSEVPKHWQRGVNPERESWCLGCVEGFLAKMNAERTAVLQASTSQAMVLVGNREDESKKAFGATNPATLARMRNIAASQAQNVGHARQAGFQKGQTLSVNKGLK